ncbi:MAG: formate dehydrogenase accessory sulfurtransferase FdhD [Actinobacteria bacterium]|nr:formate dehydrogenase accessory sulfurtransferase FdhD [Actinomycetota bacterium]
MEDKFLGLGNKIEAIKVKPLLGWEKIDDTLPSELLLTIILNDETVSVVSCSPENEIELVVGYLISNGYICHYSRINTVSLCDVEAGERAVSVAGRAKKEKFALPSRKAVVNVEVDGEESLRTIRKNKNFQLYLSSGCGSIDDLIIEGDISEVSGKAIFYQDIILKLNLETSSHQEYRKRIGGLHSSALFDREGKLLVIMEDLGRHNSIDKVIGYAFLNSINLSDKIIFTTGRITLDTVYKAAKVSVPLVVTDCSVSYGAALLARRLNLTLIGYARGQRFNIYSCPWRVLGK